MVLDTDHLAVWWPTASLVGICFRAANQSAHIQLRSAHGWRVCVATELTSRSARIERDVRPSVEAI